MRALILLSAALFVSSFASAQTVTPNLMMAPVATAQTCESPAGAQSAGCVTFVPGNAPFVLLMKANNTNTSTYRFTVVATLEDGSTKIVTGQVGRSDDKAGYTAASVTLGCEPVSVSATVNETAE